MACQMDDPGARDGATGRRRCVRIVSRTATRRRLQAITTDPDVLSGFERAVLTDDFDDGFLTGALLPFGAECRLTATFQTRFRGSLNAYT